MMYFLRSCIFPPYLKHLVDTIYLLDLRESIIYVHPKPLPILNRYNLQNDAVLLLAAFLSFYLAFVLCVLLVAFGLHLSKLISQLRYLLLLLLLASVVPDRYICI